MPVRRLKPTVNKVSSLRDFEHPRHPVEACCGRTVVALMRAGCNGKIPVQLVAHRRAVNEV
jgi:hypothetical protein